LGGDGKLELLDFKSQPRPEKHDERIPSYYQQLGTYAHILEIRDGKRPERLILYWTGKPKREDALMIFPYDPHIVDQAGAHFDDVVKCILDRKFAVNKPPDRKVCKECDLRVYCSNEKVF
jgi:DNA helicase II / ATP-dependent DNA helicase PcrA